MRGTVDKDGYQRLVEAVNSLTQIYRDRESIDRLLVACLLDVPWEVENRVEHYLRKDANLGKSVSRMGEGLRTAIGNLLWSGMEDRCTDSK